MAKFDNDIVNEYTPRMGNRLTRFIGQSLLNLMGWKVTGQFPRQKKILIAGAPHTSNWDLIIAMASMLSVGLRFSWMMKKEAFFWPLGALWKSMGGVPIDRMAKNDITTQMANWYKSHDNVWLGITPEGTRSKVDAFKKGYLRIAMAADVPVFIIGINQPTKEIVLDRIWELTGDIEADNRAIKAYIDKNFTGINPKNG